MEYSEGCNKRFDACVGSNIWIPMCSGVVLKSSVKHRPEVKRDEHDDPFVHHIKVKTDKKTYCDSELNLCKIFYDSMEGKYACN